MLQSGFDVCCLALAFQERDESGLGVAGMGFDSDDDHYLVFYSLLNTNLESCFHGDIFTCIILQEPSCDMVYSKVDSHST